MMAAVLACGPGTVVPHRSAAALLGLIDQAPGVVDVIAPGKRGATIDGTKAHKQANPGRRVRGGRLQAAARPRRGRGGDGRRPSSRGADAPHPGRRLARCANRNPSQPNLRSPFEAKLLPLLATTDLPVPLRWRDRELLRAGYITLRVPWRHAEDEPEAVLDAIRARLANRNPTA